MAKYCEIAGKTTNCTDNCRGCLEEEETVRDIEVGDRVRYIAENTEEASNTGFYPPKGTIGTVIGIEDDAAPYHIKWPEGTTKWSGRWYVDREDIELVDD